MNYMEMYESLVVMDVLRGRVGRLGGYEVVVGDEV